MTFETAELGPQLNTPMMAFSLPDHANHCISLEHLMGKAGVLLGFIGDIWHPISVRRILWLQRHLSKFAEHGTPVALVVRDYPHTLDAFHTSSPLPVPFQLLADTDGGVHMHYQMDRHPGLLLIDRDLMLRQKWLMPDDRVWPKIHELLEATANLQTAPALV